PISGVGAEPSRGPFPDVAEHVPAAERRDPAWVAADARGAEHLRIQIGARGVGRLVAPRVAALRARRRIPRGGGLPFHLRGETLTGPRRVRLRLPVADVADGSERVERLAAVHAAVHPCAAVPLPEE